MENIKFWSLAPIAEVLEAKEEEAEQRPVSHNSTLCLDLIEKQLDKINQVEGEFQTYSPCKSQVSETKIKATPENEKPVIRRYSAFEKGKHREFDTSQPSMEETSLTNIENDQTPKSLNQPDRISHNSPSISHITSAEISRARAIFFKKLARAANAESMTQGESRDNEEAAIEHIFLNTWATEPPTSARSFGKLEHKTGIWRDFAYRDPWPELPGSSRLMSPDGFGKFFSGPLSSTTDTSSSSPTHDSAKSESIQQTMYGELKVGSEFFADPRTDNRVDQWLQGYSCNESGLNTKDTDSRQKLLLKEIFENPEEVGLLRDILALIDYERILRINSYRYYCTLNFIKFYRKNAEIVLSRRNMRIKYRENLIPSMDQLNNFSRWREECAPWRPPYDNQDISSLQPLERDVNNLARTYYSIQAQEDSDVRFIPIYRAFYQLELYCRLFLVSKYAPPESTGEKLEKIKRIFFERYKPYEVGLVFKISRWLIREWNAINRFIDRQIRYEIREKIRKRDITKANHRNLGIRFFAEVLYSDWRTQMGLMDKNRWQLNAIKFTWRTTCWAAQDEDEKGNVMLIEDQELIENNNDVDAKKRFFGSPFTSWQRLQM